MVSEKSSGQKRFEDTATEVSKDKKDTSAAVAEERKDETEALPMPDPPPDGDSVSLEKDT